MPHHLVPAPFLGRLGRRGASLVLLGGIFLIHAGIIWAERRDVEGLPDSAVPHESIPFPLLGLMWAICGLIAAWVGVRHGRNDHPGWLAAAAPPLVTTASYVVAALTYVGSVGEVGVWTYFLAVVCWGAVAVLIGVLAGWPEPEVPA